MSVVERALKNLKKAAGADGRSGKHESIARVAEKRTRGNDTSFDPDRATTQSSKTVEFDLEMLRDAGLYPLGNRQLAEEYRIIKRPLIKTMARSSEEGVRRPNLVMIASALPGEGKTFTSVNLSMSLANEKDLKVLLVDADCRNPQLSRLLGVDREPGLLDFLRDPELDFGSLVLGTNIEHLHVLPLGAAADDAAELLGSARMSNLCDGLASVENQVSIWDSSPLLMTTESVALSGQCGQVLLVTNAFKTPKQAVVDAVEKIDQTAAIGLIMNRASQAADAVRYGGYYGYSYDSAE